MPDRAISDRVSDNKVPCGGVKTERMAVLDLGTNVFNLLVFDVVSDDTACAESGLTPGTIYSTISGTISGVTSGAPSCVSSGIPACSVRFIEASSSPSMIGTAGLSDGYIKPVAFGTATAALGELKTRIDAISRRCGCRIPVYAFATSAFRDAANGQLLAEHLRKETGITVDIIDGDDEARYIFEGVRISNPAVFGDLTVNKLIMDIGGGSVEFIITDGERLLWERSFPLGVARLRERFDYTDPVPDGVVSAVSEHLVRELSPLRDALKEYSPGILVGSSGSFNTFRDMIYLAKFVGKHFAEYGSEPLPEETEEFRKELHGRPSAPIVLPDFHTLYLRLLGSDREERLAMLGMSDVREKFIVLGAVITRTVLELSGIAKMWQSSYSLREGAASVLSRAALQGVSG